MPFTSPISYCTYWYNLLSACIITFTQQDKPQQCLSNCMRFLLIPPFVQVKIILKERALWWKFVFTSSVAGRSSALGGRRVYDFLAKLVYLVQ